ncbi:MAG: TniQ family protein [Methylophilaceae bacterium]|nr:TniQ family protein [Methyloradius sp.]
MLLSKPLDGELISGYSGRLRVLNGYANMKRTWRALSDFHKKPMYLTHLLAMSAQLDIVDITLNHSLLPYRRCSTPTVTYFIDEFKNPNYIDYNIFRTSGINPGFCRNCIQQDLSKHGYSYWRREHQVPGIDWCPEHEEPLQRTSDPNAFENLPIDFLNSQNFATEQIEQRPEAGSLVDRYIKISLALINNPIPILGRSNIRKLREYVEQLDAGIDFIHNKNGVPISTLVAERYPRNWLKRLCPDFETRRDNVWFDPIDNSLITGAYTEMFILFVTMLFDNDDDALGFFKNRTRLDQLESVHYHNHKPSSVKRKY